MMYVRVGKHIFLEDEKLTYDEFRKRVNDFDTPLEQLINRVNSEDRIEFLPKELQNIARYIRGKEELYD